MKNRNQEVLSLLKIEEIAVGKGGADALVRAFFPQIYKIYKI